MTGPSLFFRSESDLVFVIIFFEVDIVYNDILFDCIEIKHQILDGGMLRRLEVGHMTLEITFEFCVGQCDLGYKVSRVETRNLNFATIEKHIDRRCSKGLCRKCCCRHTL